MDWHAIDPLELALRSALIALLLFMAALMVREHPRHRVARLGAFLAVGVAAYAVQSIPGFGIPPRWWHAPVLALSAGNAVVFWVFARTLFDDDFRPREWHAIAWGLLAFAPVVNCFILLPEHHASARTMGRAIDLATFGFSVLAVVQTLSTWRADLVERRRRLRIFIVVAGAAYTTIATVVRLTRVDTHSAGGVGMLDMLALLVIVLVIAAGVIRVTSSGIFDDVVLPVAVPLPAEELAPQEPAAIDPADARLIERLEQVMTVEHFHRQEDASIGALADRLGLPEHRLRRLINQRLGHRNFNAFLNRYRLAEAKAALADPARADLPVLNIAMDAGFQSLGPFNRAFKADTGLTPTEFRRLGWKAAPAETAPTLADFEIGQ